MKKWPISTTEACLSKWSRILNVSTGDPLVLNSYFYWKRGKSSDSKVVAKISWSCTMFVYKQAKFWDMSPRSDVTRRWRHPTEQDQTYLSKMFWSRFCSIYRLDRKNYDAPRFLGSEPILSHSEIALYLLLISQKLFFAQLQNMWTWALTSWKLPVLVRAVQD